jgi:glycosyltransferase involved in cell wall biosynthesis
MADARLLLFPSEWYEPFALAIVEAFSRGTPVLAGNLPSVAEMVQDGRTGFRFTPGDADDLAAKSSLFLEDATYQAMRRNCRALYEERYTEKTN